MGCNASRQIQFVTEGPLVLDRGKTLSGTRSTTPIHAEAEVRAEAEPEALPSNLLNRRPSAQDMGTITKEMVVSVSSTACSSSHTTEETEEGIEVLSVPRPKEEEGEGAASDDDLMEGSEEKDAGTELFELFQHLAARKREEGAVSEEGAPRGCVGKPSMRRSKTACCGQQCLIVGSRFCCEHDVTRPVGRYCRPCRKRYDDWKQANQAFEEMLQELEQTTERVKSLQSHDELEEYRIETESSSTGEVEVGYASYDEDDDDDDDDDVVGPTCQSCLDPVSPSASCNRKCHEESWSLGSGMPSPESQTWRYEIMHSAFGRKVVTRNNLSPDARRYLFLKRPSVASSLSLGDESERSSIRSSIRSC